MLATFTDSPTPFHGVSTIATSPDWVSTYGRYSRRPKMHPHEATGTFVVAGHGMGLESRPALLARPLAEVHHVLQRLEPWDLHSLPARDPVGAAVGPVDAHALAHGPAEQLVDRHAEGARLDVEQGVLDGRDRLLHDAARGLAPHGVEQGDDGLPGPRVLADDQGDQAVEIGRASCRERV